MGGGRGALLIALSSALMGCAATDALTGTGVNPAALLFDSPWTWTDEEGVSTTFARWRGSEVVTTAFFGSCTLRCPMTIAKLEEIDQTLHAHGRSAEFVLVTIDPENDTVDRLRRLKETRHLPSSWHLLRGSRHDTAGFGQFLHVNVARDSGHIDHDVRISMFDAAGGLVRTFAGWDFSDDDVLAGHR
jgi:cytochrome oxidase Cu insertion factor (SCO1/SenC/PrrC family)